MFVWMKMSQKFFVQIIDISISMNIRPLYFTVRSWRKEAKTQPRVLSIPMSHDVNEHGLPKFPNETSVRKTQPTFGKQTNDRRTHRKSSGCTMVPMESWKFLNSWSVIGAFFGLSCSRDVRNCRARWTLVTVRSIWCESWLRRLPEELGVGPELEGDREPRTRESGGESGGTVGGGVVERTGQPRDRDREGMSPGTMMSQSSKPTGRRDKEVRHN